MSLFKRVKDGKPFFWFESPENSLRFVEGSVLARVGPGEYFDRHAILWLKSQRHSDGMIRRMFCEQLADWRIRGLWYWNVCQDLGVDFCEQESASPDGSELLTAMQDLHTVNASLWDAENAIRNAHAGVWLDGSANPDSATRDNIKYLMHARDPSLSSADRERWRKTLEEYLIAARRIYQLNDERSRLKMILDELLGGFIEPLPTDVKDYASIQRKA